MRVLGIVSGFVAGLGASVLVVAYAVLPASSWIVPAIPIIGAVVGLLAAWPRRAAQPQEASDA